MKKNGMYAIRTVFQWQHGYMVSQYLHGKNICSQFVKEEDYEMFCEAIGCEPELIEENKENKRGNNYEDES